MSDKMIFLKPIITEKSLFLVNTENHYTFLLNGKVNKVQVKDAVEKKYKVKVLSVKIVNKLGKRTSMGRSKIEGRKQAIKKAIVSLKSGDNISDFEIK